MWCNLLLLVAILCFLPWVASIRWQRGLERESNVDNDDTTLYVNTKSGVDNVACGIEAQHACKTIRFAIFNRTLLSSDTVLSLALFPGTYSGRENLFFDVDEISLTLASVLPNTVVLDCSPPADKSRHKSVVSSSLSSSIVASICVGAHSLRLSNHLNVSCPGCGSPLYDPAAFGALVRADLLSLQSVRFVDVQGLRSSAAVADVSLIVDELSFDDSTSPEAALMTVRGLASTPCTVDVQRLRVHSCNVGLVLDTVANVESYVLRDWIVSESSASLVSVSTPRFAFTDARLQPAVFAGDIEVRDCRLHSGFNSATAVVYVPFGDVRLTHWRFADCEFRADVTRLFAVATPDAGSHSIVNASLSVDIDGLQLSECFVNGDDARPGAALHLLKLNERDYGTQFASAVALRNVLVDQCNSLAALHLGGAAHPESTLTLENVTARGVSAASIANPAFVFFNGSDAAAAPARSDTLVAVDIDTLRMSDSLSMRLLDVRVGNQRVLAQRISVHDAQGSGSGGGAALSLRGGSSQGGLDARQPVQARWQLVDLNFERVRDFSSPVLLEASASLSLNDSTFEQCSGSMSGALLLEPHSGSTLFIYASVFANNTAVQPDNATVAAEPLSIVCVQQQDGDHHHNSGGLVNIERSNRFSAKHPLANDQCNMQCAKSIDNAACTWHDDDDDGHDDDTWIWIVIGALTAVCIAIIVVFAIVYVRRRQSRNVYETF
jgi:hypothetical protein